LNRNSSPYFESHYNILNRSCEFKYRALVMIENRW